MDHANDFILSSLNFVIQWVKIPNQNQMHIASFGFERYSVFTMKDTSIIIDLKKYLPGASVLISIFAVVNSFITSSG